MPREFRRAGVAFLYPDNWTLEDENIRRESGSVTIYSPGGAFWSLSAHPGAADPDELALAAVDAMKSEYPEVEIESIREEIAGRDMAGYDLSFYYLDLINSASVRCIRSAGAAYVVFWQAEDHELKQVEEVFRAIATSFLGNLKRGL